MLARVHIGWILCVRRHVCDTIYLYLARVHIGWILCVRRHVCDTIYLYLARVHIGGYCVSDVMYVTPYTYIWQEFIVGRHELCQTTCV